MRRVLIGTRGAIARRLIRFYAAEEDVETVAVFHEPDVEQPWVDEADYAVYLNGSTVAETYLHAPRVVSAGVDAGCDAIHPGNGLLAEHLGFHQLAAQANLQVIGADPKLLHRIQDRDTVRKLARELNIATLPSSPEVSDEEAPEAAEELGYPLYVKGSAGGAVERVEEPSALAASLGRVRDKSRVLTGTDRVYLQQRLEGMRTVGTVVVADHYGEMWQLGHYSDAVQARGRWWIGEMGEGIASKALADQLGEAATALASQLEWRGVGRVRWAVTNSGRWYLLGFSGCLPTIYYLFEEMLGIDLVNTQDRISNGERLAWQHSDIRLDRHGVQVRILHLDPASHTRPAGTLDRMQLPSGIPVESGTEEGQPCSAETDPVLLELLATAPTRQAALVRARAAVDELRVEGVPTNREALLAFLGREEYWRNEHDTRTLERLLETWVA